MAELEKIKNVENVTGGTGEGWDEPSGQAVDPSVGHAKPEDPDVVHAKPIPGYPKPAKQLD